MPERPEPAYRIIIYDLDSDQEQVIFDELTRAFIVITGTLDKNGTMHGKGNFAGPLHMRKRLAKVITEDEQFAD